MQHTQLGCRNANLVTGHQGQREGREWYIFYILHTEQFISSAIIQGLNGSEYIRAQPLYQRA